MIYYDLHAHSALSPCADNDMTPNNMANMAMLNGLGLMAVCDHNSCKNVRAFCAAAREAGIAGVPGMELTTAEEIHVVCLFPSADEAEAFSDEVRESLPPVKNRPDVFGDQLIMDDSDAVTGTEERLLLNATSIGLWEVPQLVAAHGGAAVLAHIDRHSNGVLGILGDITEDMGFRLAEVSKLASRGDYESRFPFLRFISDSDAHTLADIAEPGDENCFPDTVNDAATLVKYLLSL